MKTATLILLVTLQVACYFHGGVSVPFKREDGTSVDDELLLNEENIEEMAEPEGKGEVDEGEIIEEREDPGQDDELEEEEAVVEVPVDFEYQEQEEQPIDGENVEEIAGPAGEALENTVEKREDEAQEGELADPAGGVDGSEDDTYEVVPEEVIEDQDEEPGEYVLEDMEEPVDVENQNPEEAEADEEEFLEEEIANEEPEDLLETGEEEPDVGDQAQQDVEEEVQPLEVVVREDFDEDTFDGAPGEDNEEEFYIEDTEDDGDELNGIENAEDPDQANAIGEEETGEEPAPAEETGEEPAPAEEVE